MLTHIHYAQNYAGILIGPYIKEEGEGLEMPYTRSTCAPAYT